MWVQPGHDKLGPYEHGAVVRASIVREIRVAEVVLPTRHTSEVATAHSGPNTSQLNVLNLQEENDAGNIFQPWHGVSVTCSIHVGNFVNGVRIERCGRVTYEHLREQYS